MKKQPAPGAPTEEQFLEEMGHALAGWSDPAAHLRNALQKDELQLCCPWLLDRPDHELPYSGTKDTKFAACIAATM